MIKNYFFHLAWICTLFICSCSVEIEQGRETPGAQVETTPVISSTSVFPVTPVPVTWAHLNLTGKLIYLNSTGEGGGLASNVQMLDLATGELATIFSASSSWIYYATVSPDAKTLVLSYSPPSQSSASSARSLYTLPLDGSAEPQLLFTPPTAADRYTQAEWAPDGMYIYYTHYNQETLAQAKVFEDYDLWRINNATGVPEKTLEHAFWPRLSFDSSKLVYVSLEPESGRNELFVANGDGSSPQRVNLSGPQALEIIDAPIFSPDGSSILFSAPEPSQSYHPNIIERMMGIQVVKAHSVPSDWWSVPVTGGAATRLTNLHTINLFASISPDRQHIASLSGEGIFVMDPDGSNLTQLISDPRVHGTVSWIP